MSPVSKNIVFGVFSMNKTKSRQNFYATPMQQVELAARSATSQNYLKTLFLKKKIVDNYGLWRLADNRTIYPEDGNLTVE